MTDTNTEANKAEAFTKQDAEKQHYSMPDQAGEAAEYIAKLRSVFSDKEITYNFNPEAMPEGFDLLVLPVAQRVEEKGNVISGVCIAAVPSMAALLNHPGGEKFVNEAVLSAFSVKLGNAVRPRRDGTTAGSVPQTVEDFIENRRATGGLATFTEISPQFVKALRAKGIKFMTATLLRQIWQSAAFAESQFPKVAQDTWVKVLDQAITVAVAKKLDPAVLENWKSTRDQAGLEEVTDFELDIAGLTGEAEAA